jgi:hypothetical protein
VRVLLKPSVAALQDKTKEVRDLAEELLMYLFARVDVESIRAVCKEIHHSHHHEDLGSSERAPPRGAPPIPLLRRRPCAG